MPDTPRTADERRALAYGPQAQPLEFKLDAIAGAVQTTRLAHQEEMGVECWAILNRVETMLGEATMAFFRHNLTMAKARFLGAEYTPATLGGCTAIPDPVTGPKRPAALGESAEPRDKSV